MMRISMIPFCAIVDKVRLLTLELFPTKRTLAAHCIGCRNEEIHATFAVLRDARAPTPTNLLPQARTLPFSWI